MSKGSGRRPESKQGSFSSGYDLIWKREPRIGTPERDAWQNELNERARALLDSVPIRNSFPDQTHRCDRCGKPSMPGHIHTCNSKLLQEQLKEIEDEREKR